MTYDPLPFAHMGRWVSVMQTMNSHGLLQLLPITVASNISVTSLLKPAKCYAHFTPRRCVTTLSLQLQTRENIHTRSVCTASQQQLQSYI